MSDLKENINVKEINSLKRQIDLIWERELKPLIEKRNEILDAYNDSLAAFQLPEIILIDGEIDRIEVKILELHKKYTLWRISLKIMRKNAQLLRKLGKE